MTKDISLVDPLSEVTRKERRILLGLSMLGIFFVKAGVLPSKISALGVELESTDQNAFLYLMSFGLLYFLIAFFIYSMSDFIVWRNAITSEYIKSYEEYMAERDYQPQDQYAAELHSEEQRAYERNKLWRKLTKPMSISRAAFDFILPLMVGVYSIFSMIIYASTNT